MTSDEVDTEPTWCEQEHGKGEACTSEWRGVVDRELGSELLHRIIQRPGELPKILISLQGKDGHVIADFTPSVLLGLNRDLIGDIHEIL